MAAPHAQLRKQLSAPGLLQSVRAHFSKIAEPRRKGVTLALADVLMSG